MRYEVVMRGSGVPVGRCQNAICLAGPARNHSASPAIIAGALNREWQRGALSHDLTEKGRAGRTRELDGEVLPDQRSISRDHDDLEVARPRLKQSSTPRRLFHQHLA